MLNISQLADFIGFFIIGIVIAAIFDFFRAYRHLKRTSAHVVIIQDIIYFIIATVIIMFGVINILDTSMRVYIFIAIILGCLLHFKFFSKYIIKLYEKFFSVSKSVFEFIILPTMLNLHVIVKICIFIKKIAKKCCKKFFYVVTFIQKLLIKRKTKDKKQKRVLKYEKSI